MSVILVADQNGVRVVDESSIFDSLDEPMTPDEFAYELSKLDGDGEIRGIFDLDDPDDRDIYEEIDDEFGIGGY